uniref:Uncharacterized protein n=1 Tax=Anguilla anguilla TaxID=7936 RepID=A0A0E9SSD3_ANGAN
MCPFREVTGWYKVCAPQNRSLALYVSPSQQIHLRLSVFPLLPTLTFLIHLSSHNTEVPPHLRHSGPC